MTALVRINPVVSYKVHRERTSITQSSTRCQYNEHIQGNKMITWSCKKDDYMGFLKSVQFLMNYIFSDKTPLVLKQASIMKSRIFANHLGSQAGPS